MTIQEFFSLAAEASLVYTEIFDVVSQIILFSGFYDDMPEKYLSMELLSWDTSREEKNTIHLNVQETGDKKFIFDPSNWNSVVELMNNYKLSGELHGGNRNGEETAIRIYSDKVIVHTYQKNGWTRVNEFYRDGKKKELYPCKWNV